MSGRTIAAAQPAGRAVRAMAGLGRSVLGFLPYIVGFCSLFLAWHVVAVYVVASVLFPPPTAVLLRAIALWQDGTLQENIGVSLRRIVIGFVAGSVLGIPVGLVIGSFPLARKLLEPWTEFLRFIPSVAMITVAVIWFGIGETSKITLLFLAALPVSAVAARDGVRNVSIVRVQAAQSLGASRWQIFRYVIFPSALAEIFTGARLAIGAVYGTLIAAEIIAGTSGIGWLILDAGRFLRSDYVFVGIFIIDLLGILLDRALVTAEHRIVHWAGK